MQNRKNKIAIIMFMSATVLLTGSVFIPGLLVLQAPAVELPVVIKKDYRIISASNEATESAGEISSRITEETTGTLNDSETTTSSYHFIAKPAITSPKPSGVVFTESCTITAQIDSSSTAQELWINGRRAGIKNTSSERTVKFNGVKLLRQSNLISIVSKKVVSGKIVSSSTSDILTLYHFTLPLSYKRLIIIDRSDFNIYWIVNGVMKKVYPIAIGKDDTPTPISKWIVGQKSYEDPKGVFGPRRLRLYRLKDGKYVRTGYGIHGTNQPWVIGKKASHGCIRVENKDILDLWPQVTLGDHVITQQ